MNYEVTAQLWGDVWDLSVHSPHTGLQIMLSRAVYLVGQACTCFSAQDLLENQVNTIVVVTSVRYIGDLYLAQDCVDCTVVTGRSSSCCPAPPPDSTIQFLIGPQQACMHAENSSIHPAPSPQFLHQNMGSDVALSPLLMHTTYHRTT